MALTILISVGFILYLCIEAFVHNRRLNTIPLRISVSGTRGKSAVVRMLASVLREDGRKVLAKTTGSEANYILPDGRIEKLRRFGMPNIIEQKDLVKIGSRENIDVLITEIMSIQPENHLVESRRLIKPHITLLTNFLPDHLTKPDQSEEDMTELFMNDLYKGSRVFVNIADYNEQLNKLVSDRGGRIVDHNLASGNDRLVEKDRIIKNTPKTKNPLKSNTALTTYSDPEEQNSALVSSVARHLGVKDSIIYSGLNKTVFDIGETKIFLISKGSKEISFVNAFAANDPLSSERVIRKILNGSGKRTEAVDCILSLRSDRPERSAQWLRYLKNNRSRYGKIFVCGLSSSVFKRNIYDTICVRAKDPAIVTEMIFNESGSGPLVVGLGNIKGSGTDLIRYWQVVASSICKIS